MNAKSREPARKPIANLPFEPSASSAQRSSKSVLIDLLQREEGATIAAITVATGWQSHSARAALSGLRKRGFTVSRTSEQGVATYRITGAA